MTMKGKVKRMRIYMGEEASYHDKPLYLAILERARKLDIAGGTVFKCVAGYGANTRKIRTTSFLDLSSDLPIVIELIDTIENLATLEVFLTKNLKKGLVTMEDIYVVGYSANFEPEKITDEVREKIKKDLTSEK